MRYEPRVARALAGKYTRADRLSWRILPSKPGATGGRQAKACHYTVARGIADSDFWE